MIHPRTLKILVVVLLLHAGVLMLIQLGLIQSPLSKEEPPELQVNLIPATPEPIKQPEPPKQQPVKQEAPKQVNIVKPVPQPKPTPMPTPTLPPSDNAPVAPATPPAPPAPPAEPAPAPAAAPSGPISVGINDIQCSDPQPAYPSMSQKMGEEGRAMVKLSIGTAGEVTNVAVTSSSGSPRLDRAATEAARSIKCTPYKQNGHAVPVVASKPYVFKLDN
ncbi:energy transducer TonB [Ralstonia sp. A12]|uniref:energy transducer TonB n=1 Tax=Ralstonia sp. A12 TaxID=1217052 RepID=UPI000573AAC5|nr:energy transducer TonB [Ralstonia sp. A12]KHK51631.1 energy transducer TonB [Ralstonia sp. A12]